MTHSFNLKVTGAAVAFALAALAGTASAAAPGYVTDQQNQVWTSPYGLCWKTTDWTPDTSKLLRQRGFAHNTLSSRRSM